MSDPAASSATPDAGSKPRVLVIGGLGTDDSISFLPVLHCLKLQWIVVLRLLRLIAARGARDRRSDHTPILVAGPEGVSGVAIMTILDQCRNSPNDTSRC